MNSFQNPTYPQMDNIPPSQSAPMGYQQQQPGYQAPMYPQYQQPFQPQQMFPQQQQQPGFQTGPITQLPIEQSYIENILRLNKDKVATVYMNFENSQWGSKIFKGAIEAAGKDHIILRDTVTQMRYLLLTIYLNYITFDQEINYEYPFAAPNFPGITPNVPGPGYQQPGYQAPNTTLRKKENKDEDK